MAIAQGMAANPDINIEMCATRAFVERAFELARGLSEAAAPEVDEDEEAPRIVRP